MSAPVVSEESCRVLVDQLIAEKLAKKSTANPLIYKGPKISPLVPRPQVGRRERSWWRDFRQTAFFAGSPKPRLTRKPAKIRGFSRPAAGEINALPKGVVEPREPGSNPLEGLMGAIGGL